MADSDAVRRRVTAVWRIESVRIVATLAAYTRDFALAEDLAQEALATALETWPAQGVPGNPGAWLVQVGKRRAIDGWRRQDVEREKYRQIALETQLEADEPSDPDHIGDEVLRLMFIACHPVLAREAQIALTLRTVAGLTTEEIARGFTVPVATVQQRIVRAKKTLGAANVPFEMPSRDELPSRLDTVRSVLYLIFTEGHVATSGEAWMREDLAYEAIRLARMLAAQLPKDPETLGLLALMELTAARFPARTGTDGAAIPLDQQNRKRWDRTRIASGREALARADALSQGRGAYAMQAAIALEHASAPTFDRTDWARIVLLYEALGRINPSPIVELNRAVAVSMSTGPASALHIVDALEEADALRDSHLLPSVRGELLARLGRRDEARIAIARAIALAGNQRERDVLRAKAAAL